MKKLLPFLLIFCLSCKKKYPAYACGCEFKKLPLNLYDYRGSSPFGRGEVVTDKNNDDAKAECDKYSSDYKTKFNDTLTYYKKLNDSVYIECDFEESKPQQ